MNLIRVDAVSYLNAHAPIDQQVIYLDPMFPERKKSAAVKKEMIHLQQIVGEDRDSDQLFEAALAAGAHRVVVKRSRHAPHLSGQKPPLVFEGKSCRFDVYPLKRLDDGFFE
jgi:16S rRNA (guanine1516-N2)-methyltransferase